MQLHHVTIPANETLSLVDGIQHRAKGGDRICLHIEGKNGDLGRNAHCCCAEENLIDVGPSMLQCVFGCAEAWKIWEYRTELGWDGWKRI
jgi:hypothetical protein